MPENQQHHPPSEQAPGSGSRVTLPQLWRFFLVAVVGIVAGYCVECIEAVQAITETFPWHRDR